MGNNETTNSTSSCQLCHPKLDAAQSVLFSNEHCLFLQLKGADEKGVALEGAGIIVPKQHRETVFDLTSEEWNATYSILQDVKRYIDTNHQPDGYNIGWNCGTAGGQHLPHAHLHVLPRYADEPYAGKGIRHLFKGEGNQRTHPIREVPK
ncbi:HIT family protein [Sporosarcina koreensis]|uniref:HIT family protein n=1 Tax=Sporosarcina koreensis TaxID=334735 RepID=UPI000693D76A|nr:HIT domain-containing protein [Sporosarcina koreensis]